MDDKAADIFPHLYADADFAGCAKTARSTTGVHLCLKGERTYFPCNGISKKQDAVSHSTPEAEIVAAAFAIRREGLPSQQLWTLLLRPPGGGAKKGARGAAPSGDDPGASVGGCAGGDDPGAGAGAGAGAGGGAGG